VYKIMSTQYNYSVIHWLILDRGPFTAKENLESGGRFIYWGLGKMYGGV
jgi:hypothetical protein